jgi:hypothetical protein
MTKRKIVIILALLIFSSPIIGFAQGNNPGVPFKDLQNQINNMQQEIKILQGQLLNIEANQKQPEPQGSEVVANRITNSVHGVVDENGLVLNPSDKFEIYKTEFYDVIIYHIRLLHMSHDTKTPTCVASPGPHSVAYNLDLRMYQDYPFFYNGAWEFAVISQGSTGYAFSQYNSGFSFICIQE